MALLIGTLVLSGASLGQDAPQGETMTNAQFANILADVLGLEMPADADSLSDAELFEVWANMLAERGITLFVDAKPDALVTKCDLANVVYDALIGPNDATIEEKINYLAGLDYISAGTTCEVMNFNEIIATLNIPALSMAIAEAYSPSGVGRRGRGRTGVLSAPANPAPQTLTYP